MSLWFFHLQVFGCGINCLKHHLKTCESTHVFSRTIFFYCQCCRTGFLLQGTWNGICTSMHILDSHAQHLHYHRAIRILVNDLLEMYRLPEKNPTSCSVHLQQSVLPDQVFIIFLQTDPSVSPKHNTREFFASSLLWKLWFLFPNGPFCLRPSIAEGKGNL